MKVNIKSPYRYLISHTFPGLLLLLEIIFLLRIWKDYVSYKSICLINIINDIINIVSDMPNLIMLLTIFFIFSTLIGIVIDAFRHLLFREPEKKLKDKEIYEVIKNADQLALYNRIDDDYWYFYEAYGNIALALSMLPLTLLILISGKYILILFFTIIVIAMFNIPYKKMKEKWGKWYSNKMCKDNGKLKHNSYYNIIASIVLVALLLASFVFCSFTYNALIFITSCIIIFVMFYMSYNTLKEFIDIQEKFLSNLKEQGS